MDIHFDNGLLTIVLPAEISSANASSVEEEIGRAEHLPEAEKILLDAGELTYISSAGLRILMRLLKTTKAEITVRDVSHEIYDIFHMTGLTRLFTVVEKLEYIDTKDADLLGAGVYGSVYRLTPELVMKVYHDDNCREILEKTLENAQRALLAGIPTMLSFKTVRTDKGLGLIYELFEGESMSDVMREDPEHLADYAREMAELALLMAETEIDDGGMSRRSERLSEELEAARPLIGEDIFDKLSGYLRAVPERDTPVHGDFHSKNMMKRDGELMLIDMDDFALGHPVWDIACFYRIFRYFANLSDELGRQIFDLPEELAYADFYEKMIGVPSSWGETVWTAFTGRYFEGYGDAEKEACMALAAFYSDYMVIRLLIDRMKAVSGNEEKRIKKMALIRSILDRMEEKDFDALSRGFGYWR